MSQQTIETQQHQQIQQIAMDDEPVFKVVNLSQVFKVRILCHILVSFVLESRFFCGVEVCKKIKTNQPC